MMYRFIDRGDEVLREKSNSYHLPGTSTAADRWLKFWRGVYTVRRQLRHAGQLFNTQPLPQTPSLNTKLWHRKPNLLFVWVKLLHSVRTRQDNPCTTSSSSPPPPASISQTLTSQILVKVIHTAISTDYRLQKFSTPNDCQLLTPDHKMISILITVKVTTDINKITVYLNIVNIIKKTVKTAVHAIRCDCNKTEQLTLQSYRS